MQSGANTTYVFYRLVRAGSPIELSIKVLADYGEEHCVTVGRAQPMEVTPVERGLQVVAVEGATPFYILSDSASALPAKDWYRNFDLAAERARGLPDRSDHFFAGEFRATIAPGGSLTMVASTAATPSLNGETSFAKRQFETGALLDRFFAANNGTEQAASPAVQQLVLAADQFIVARPLDGAADAKTILAGYPWFSDWGRDTMIALPGLCLATGRPWLARNILRTFSRFVSEGMLPNQFPRAGAAPVYNTVDATLWYFEAVRQYFEAASDIGLLNELFPVLDSIIDAHVRGTRYHIHVDPADGLLYAGEPGVQLTWMDAKVGDLVVTPRVGKPVEVNALWLNAAASMARFARALGRNAARYEDLTKRAQTGFARFWNSEKQFCFDVIDIPGKPRWQGRHAAAQSDPCSLTARNCSLSGTAARRCGCVRAGASNFVRTSQPRADGGRLPRALRWKPRGARRRLPSRHGMGMAARSIRAGSLARVPKRRRSDVFSGTDVRPHQSRRAWHGQRNF